MMARRIQWAALVTAMGLCITGCNLLTPFIFVGDHKKKFAAEFDKLPGHRVAVLVWADRSTLYDYPFVRFELASYLVDKISTELTQRQQSATFVDPRDVEDFIQKNIDAQVDPAMVGTQFKSDYVVYVELLGFQIRDGNQPQFLQGQVEASVSVLDLRGGAGKGERFELVPVRVKYPEGAPVVFSASNAPLVREQVYRMFTEVTARKFYEHSVEL